MIFMDFFSSLLLSISIDDPDLLEDGISELTLPISLEESSLFSS
jgi:hypothetical protein